MTFTVLAVCAANVCRSPLMAVGLERAFLARGLGGDVVVLSAGVTAGTDAPVCPELERLTRSRGLPWLALGQHRSAPLTDRLIDRADLVLTADRSLRSEIVKRARPGATGRTFTLREAAELADATSFRVQGHTVDEQLRGLTAQMNHSRGFTDLPGVQRVVTRALPWRRLEVHTHDVPDAHEEPRAPHGLVCRLIVPATDHLAASLAHGAMASLP
jgi:protein-tyrosine phosphatase